MLLCFTVIFILVYDMSVALRFACYFQMNK